MSSRIKQVLFSVGLVLSGLLLGVLVMQLTERGRMEPPAELRTVEFHKNAPLSAEQKPDMAGVLQLVV